MGKGWKKAGKLEIAQKKGALFTKLAREIAVAARLGGSDPESNARLKLAIHVAREASCPKDTIERAIKKGSGQLDGNSVIEEIIYEGYGPYGVGVLVECQTDNRNRTVSEIRSIFKSHGGSLAESGAVMWMFKKVALVRGHHPTVTDPEAIAIEIGADDVEAEDEGWSFTGRPEDLEILRTGLIQLGWKVQVAELSFIPKETSQVSEANLAEVVQLLEALDDNEDSHRIHATLA